MSLSKIILICKFINLSKLAVSLEARQLLNEIESMMSKLQPPISGEICHIFHNASTCTLSELVDSLDLLSNTATSEEGSDPSSLMNILKAHRINKMHPVKETDSSVLEDNPKALLEKLGLVEYYTERLQLQDAVCVLSEPLQLSLGRKKLLDPKKLPFLVLHKLMSYDRSDLLADDEQDSPSLSFSSHSPASESSELSLSASCSSSTEDVRDTNTTLRLGGGRASSTFNSLFRTTVIWH